RPSGTFSARRERDAERNSRRCSRHPALSSIPGSALADTSRRPWIPSIASPNLTPSRPFALWLITLYVGLPERDATSRSPSQNFFSEIDRLEPFGIATPHLLVM